MEIAEHVLQQMAEAMLEPELYTQGKRTLPEGNINRVLVLKRAIYAAKVLGWEMREVDGCL